MPPAIAYAVAGHLATKTVGAIWVFSALMLLSATMWWSIRWEEAGYGGHPSVIHC